MTDVPESITCVHFTDEMRRNCPRCNPSHMMPTPDLARPMTVAEAAEVLLAENIEGSLAKSMAHFVSVKEWEGYKRGVQAYTERLRALSQGGE